MHSIVACLRLSALAIAGLALSTIAYAQSSSFTVYPARGVGSQVSGPLVQASDGNFYGVTSQGFVFRFTPAGQVTAIYRFSATVNGRNSDGAGPQGGLLLGRDGALYGTTLAGGDNGAGTVFRVTLDGQFTTLASFDSFAAATYGQDSPGPLVEDSNGNLYGVHNAGGPNGNGTIFKVTPGGALSLLHAFSTINNGMNYDGAKPRGGLAIDSAGNLYGTTTTAGAHDGGTVFEISAGGAFATLYSFSAPSTAIGGNLDGDAPWGSLVLAGNGNLYGVTQFGGANVTGTVFMISPGGSLTTIHTFSDFDHTTGANADGAHPLGLTLGSDGNLYGVTAYSGANATGTLFMITRGGSFTTLYSFGGSESSQTPPLLGSDGALYGAGFFSKGLIYQFEFTATTPTNTGSNVTVTSRQASVTFTQVTSAGTTTFTSITPATAGTPPSGFTLCPSCPAYDITTTATYTPPITVCLDVPASISQQTFSTLALLHGENGVLVDRTTNRITNPDGTREVCGTVSSLSPFVLAQTGTPPAGPGQLLNISTRMKVLSGDNALIGGFIVTGTDPKKVGIRAIGPSLPISGVLADPTLELHDGSGAVIASNDNWKINDATGQSQEADVRATGIPPTNDLESIIVITLPANNATYTAVMRGRNNTTGIGLVEAYDLSQPAKSQLANISTRGFVDTGDNVMIGGFISGNGTGADRVIVRAIGPSLPVSGSLQDPVLELHNSSGTTIASNDDWQSDPNAAQVQAAGVAPKDTRESALYMVVPPAAYTAIVRGKNNTTGIGLVEVYNLQ